MIVDPDFLDHWRTGMVADSLGDPMAALYILRLWGHCQERKSDRFVMPARGLKAQCKFPGDADAFEAALIEAGFITRDGGAIHVTGWADKNASLLAAWENGSRGGRPKKTQTKPMGSESVTHGQPSGNPDETHGEPKPNPDETDKRREEEKPPVVPQGGRETPTIPCPYERIVSAYHEALPELPKAKLMPVSRQRAMRKLWGWVLSSSKSDGTRRATDTESALAWIRGYFEHASRNDFLMHRTPRSAEHANWQCDIDFLMTEKGMKQVIEKTQEEQAA